MNRAPRLPRQGEIWWTNLPTDPPEKGRRPVVIVSTDGRQSTSSFELGACGSAIEFGASFAAGAFVVEDGGDGLGAESAVQADNITTVVRDSLTEPRPGQRALSHTKVCELAKLVRYAMGCK